MKLVPNGWAAVDALRLSWRHATPRRRATVVAVAALPFLVASGVIAILLSYGRDTREPPRRVERSPDVPARQTDVKLGATVEQSGDATAKPAGQGERAESAGADRPVTARAARRRRDNGERPRRSRGRRPARRLKAGPRIDRRNSAAPGPAPRTPSRRGRRGGDRRRRVPNPGPLPTSTLAPPPADATAPARLAGQPAPAVMESNPDYGGDSDDGRPATTPVGKRATGAPVPRAREREPENRRDAPHRPEHAAPETHPEHPHQAGGGEPRATGPVRP
jgi:hypothetical protein